MDNKNNIMFFATILIGVVGICSPLSVFAQEYNEYEYEGYNTYDPYSKDSRYETHDPYMSERSNDKSISPYQSAYCDNSNVNIIGLDQNQIQRQTQNNESIQEQALDAQQLTPEEAWNSLNDNNNGESLLNIDRNMVNVCLNDNENSLIASFSGLQAGDRNRGNSASASQGDTTSGTGEIP
jgi:hypothetical protein